MISLYLYFRELLESQTVLFVVTSTSILQFDAKTLEPISYCNLLGTIIINVYINAACLNAACIRYYLILSQSPCRVLPCCKTNIK